MEAKTQQTKKFETSKKKSESTMRNTKMTRKNKIEDTTEEVHENEW